MITDKAAATLLLDSGEGDILLVGQLLKGISDENIAWQIIEKLTITTKREGVRITLHAYWHDIFIVSKVVTVNPDNTLKWGVTKA